jgi:tetratricopeptide (TPR) repeat protein
MSETPNPTQPSPPPDSAETDLARMERELKEQLDQAGKNPRDVLWQLARLYNATKRHDQALQCLRRILASESDLEVKASCVLALGQTMEQCNDFPAAITCYREALAMEPMGNRTWYFIHNNLGYCYNQVGEFEEGERFCRSAIEINPCPPNGHKNLGIALAAQGKYREAALSYITGTFNQAGDARSFKLLQELINEHPELAFEFQSHFDRCEKSVRFAAVALERARSGRPFKVLLGAASLEWLNLCGYTLQAISGGAVGIQVVENLSQFIEAAGTGDFDLGFLAPGSLPAGSADGTSTDLWEQAVRAIRQIKSQKPIALVLVGGPDDLTQHDAAGRASGVDAMLEADHQQTDALVETMIHLLTQHNPATSNP